MIAQLLALDWLNALAGLLVGTIVGITGVGGGSLMSPILILIFGVFLLLESRFIRRVRSSITARTAPTPRSSGGSAWAASPRRSSRCSSCSTKAGIR